MLEEHANTLMEFRLNDLSGVMTCCGFAELNAHWGRFPVNALAIALANAIRQLSQDDGQQFVPQLDFGKPRQAIERVCGSLSNSPNICVFRVHPPSSA